jgi:hypothetical protein
VTVATLSRLPASGRWIFPKHACADQPIVRRMARWSNRLTSFFKQGIPMKKFAIAAGLLMISASAHAGTYSYDGVTVHVQDGCRSSSCVSVSAPGYGYYHGKRSVKVAKVHKDTSRIVSAKENATQATEATPAKTPEAATPAPSSDVAPAK